MLLNTNMKKLITVAIIVLGIAGIAVLAKPKQSAALDAFAMCVRDAGAVMYGADWCPHCQNEKRAFGTAFRFIPYVECPDNPNLCIGKGVTGYPLWTFPDGRRLEGEQGLARIAAASGCSLESNRIQ